MSVAQTQVVAADADWSRGNDERELIERAKRDRNAFAELYRRHHPTLLSHVYRRTGDVHATEDIVADVFLTALRTLPRYRYRGVPVRFWLLRIATNAVNRWARRSRRRAAAALEALDPEDVGQAAPPDGQFDTERAACALLSLSPKHQAVLSLHYFEGLAVREIATVVGCREGTVKSRLSRARDILREKLNGRR
jgi:RNA polymerase sigma-70 factor (ECF subfamily)